MKKFESVVHRMGSWWNAPTHSNTRIMMMPVLLEDADSLPITAWQSTFEALAHASPVRKGVAYLTIDAALVRAGETHRRPGLHVDGVGPDGKPGGWGGGGGGWGKNGMLVWSNIRGCCAWDGEFEGEPGPDGDCEHLREQLSKHGEVHMVGCGVYFCGPLAVHESVPMRVDTHRSFMRLSLPNDCPWYEGYTENPLGIKPTGPIHPRRASQMAYRA